MNPAVSMRGVTQVYVTEQGTTLAVENIYLAVQPGEFVSLVGPSGCGKTTILSMIAGLTKPTSGEIAIHSTSPSLTGSPVGYMQHQDYLFPWRTIWDNACIGLELQGVRNGETEKYTDHLLEEMGILPYKSRYPQQLSRGMRQRAALVRTLTTQPEILLLDEPFSALDYQSKLQMEDLVFETLKARRKTVILVTHDISEAIAMSDKIVVLQRNPGKIRRLICVPDQIRRAIPFQARELEGFSSLFQCIWRELEAADTGR